MNAIVTTTVAAPVAAPVDTSKALTIAYDARDAAIVRAQDLAAQVKARRAELDALVAEAHAAVVAVHVTTGVWAEAMRDHAAAVDGAATDMWRMLDAGLGDTSCDAVLAFDPNAL
ncbi:hypothetical protein ABZT49_06135 [Methylobacterium sp. EM32]|uniref:hypothetical protein n=1 Tax=Methylobacterium sp. EM32 TaxID=3163481 RepID=UPI0033A9F485